MKTHKALKKSRCLVITGKAGAGKDTVADMIYDMKASPRPRPFRFSEPLKEIVAQAFGWSVPGLGRQDYKEEPLEELIHTVDGKLLRNRRAVLQYVGTDVFRAMKSDCWVNAALTSANSQANAFDCSGFIATDCRFANEHEALKKHFGTVRTVRLVKVGGAQLSGTAASHASEALEGVEPDKTYAIDAGDFDALKAVAHQLVQFFKEAP